MRRLMRFAVALAILLATSAPARAVLIDAADGAGNVLPPVPELAHVAKRGGASAVYLGDGAVLTASHVGAGPVEIDGVSYPAVPGSEWRLENEDGSEADLLLFAIEPHPGLEPLAIAEVPPPIGTFLIVSGNGRNRGEPTAWDPHGPMPPGLTGGYGWASGRALRWGTNFVEVLPWGRVQGTEVFGSGFDPGAPGDEAQGVSGDSGGAAFAAGPLGLELAGLIIAIVQYPQQPAETTFYGQTTYYADLALYREQILDAVALPEPRGGLVVGLALVAALRARRRRSAAQLPHQSRLRSRATASASVPSLPSG